MNFSLKNIDGRLVSLADFPEAKGFILVFTCNHCPYAIAYEDRLQALHVNFAPQGFPLIAINPNDATRFPQDSFANMQQRAQEKGFSFPYLHDETQAVAKLLGAERTPHAFVLQRGSGGENLRVVYEGAIDDNYQNAALVREAYVAEQVQQLLDTGRSGYTETVPIGCSIKWKMSQAV